MDHTEIAGLLHRAASGDQEAWERIVDEYSSLLQAVVRGFRLSEAQSADVVQTTWLRLVENLGAIREPERLAGWLRTTARRVCLEVVRESGRENLVDPARDEGVFVTALGWQHQEDRPETGLLHREREALVRRAVATLPERKQRLLGLLVASPPVSYEEISARLEMPIGSIGPTRARILARLRTAIEASDFHDLALG